LVAGARNARKAIGAVVAAAGFLCAAAYVAWVETRTLMPVEQPIRLAAGHSAYPFSLNVDQDYLVELQVPATRPLGALACDLGVDLDIVVRKPPCTTPALLRMSWTLTDGERTVASFRSDADRSSGVGNHALLRPLGGFAGKSGHRYLLDVAVEKDATQVASRDPILRVQVPAAYAEDLSGKLLLSILAGAGCVAMGLAVFFSRPSTAPQPARIP
jgi:hypothetical protein